MVVYGMVAYHLSDRHYKPKTGGAAGGVNGYIEGPLRKAWSDSVRDVKSTGGEKRHRRRDARETVRNMEPTFEMIRPCDREFLAEYKVPKEILFEDALPTTANGKVHKPTLRKRFSSQACRGIG